MVGKARKNSLFVGDIFIDLILVQKFIAKLILAALPGEMTASRTTPQKTVCDQR